MLRFFFSRDMLGPWCATIIAVLLAVGTYRFAARRFQPQIARLRQGTSSHPLVTLLLILACMIGGVIAGIGVRQLHQRTPGDRHARAPIRGGVLRRLVAGVE